MQTLVTQRRFAPYFITQALGAFNDNLYKNVLLILVAFAAPDSLAIDSNLYINLAAGLFVLPFFLFSPFAGELADKYEKSYFIRCTKLAEVIIMLLAAIAFAYQSYTLLLLLLFLMGTQSAFFGPVKYSLLPQITKPQELLSANAWVEAFTFLAILGGSITAAVVASYQNAPLIAAIMVLGCALAGLFSAHFIPRIAASNPKLIVRLAWKRQFKHTLYTIKQQQTIWLAILAISWFWFLGASYLTQLPNYTQALLGGNEQLVSVLLALFSVGIAIGAFVCASLPKLNCTKIGIVGLSLFGFALYFCTPAAEVGGSELSDFVANPKLWGVFVSLLWIGISAGLYVVPLYTKIQRLAEPSKRSQIIAGSNIVDALFMVLSALLGILLLVVLQITLSKYYLVLALLNTGVASLIFHQAAFVHTSEPGQHDQA